MRPLSINYHKRVDGEANVKYVFVLDRPFSSLPMLSPHEVFLESIGSDRWFYGGDRFLDQDERNCGLVITDPSVATAFMLSEHVGG